MAYVLTSFAGVTIPPHLGKGGLMDIGGGHLTSRPSITGTGIIYHPLISLPGGNHFDPLQGTVGTRSVMDLTIQTNLIVQDGTLRTQLDKWLALQGVRGTLIRQGDDSYQTTALARLVQVDVNREYIHRRFMPMKLIFTVSGLPWSGAGHTIPVVYPTTAITLTNIGNVTQRNLQFTVTNTSGSNPITVVEFQNGTVGHIFTYVGSLPPGGVLVFDTGARAITVNGTDAYAGAIPPGNFEEWFALAPGANACGIFPTGTSISCSTSIFFTDSWG